MVANQGWAQDPRMSFESDLLSVLETYFREEAISYIKNSSAAVLAARYCEVHTRRIKPTPRRVHFSEELHDSLGKLSRVDQTAWGTVFHLRHLFESGADVTPYLSKRVASSESKDPMLWDYGLHHFHLNEELGGSGFVERADHLLFALVSAEEVFFVDVRAHQDPERLLWVRQDLLTIMDSNWPGISKDWVLHGVQGDTLTDTQKKELRRKNVNHVRVLGKQAIGPLGGGVMADGSSTLCKFWAAKLLFEVEQHESYFSTQAEEVRAALRASGIDVAGGMELRLVPLDSLDPMPEVVELLGAESCLSKGLSRMGFAVVEATTGAPIVVSLTQKP